MNETLGDMVAAPQAIAMVELTGLNFQQVMAGSVEYPIIVDFWATWCEPCKQLKPVLQQLTAEYGGRFLLATVDIDAQSEIAQMFQVQSVPTVVAVIAGRPVPLFTGVQTAEQVRAVIDQVLQIAVQSGITGRAPIAEVAAEPEAPQVENKALKLEATGDLEGALAAWQEVLSNNPKDQEALSGQARVRIALRAQNSDVPDDSEPAILADRFMAAGNASAAFEVLLKAIAQAKGDERDTLRAHMIEALSACSDSELVRQARMRLSTLLLV